jgi:hypothetical protein
MDCKEVKKRIDEMSPDMNPEPEKEVLFHLRSCSACQKYYDDQIRMIRVVTHLRDQEPELKNPGALKSAILSSVENEKNTSGSHPFPMVFLIRFLAAASVVLLLTLGIEQYTVLRKVQHLEAQLGKVKPASAIPEMMLSRASLVDIQALLSGGEQQVSMKNLLLWARMKQFENSDFTYQDLKRNIPKDKSIEKIISTQQQKLKKQKP